MTPMHWIGVLIAAMASVLSVLLLRRHAGAGGRRFFSHPVTAIASWWLIFLLMAALCAPLLAPYRPSLQLDIVSMANQPPSPLHPLGTDLYSRDIWSRLLYGARVSLGVGTLGMLVAIAAGGIVGTVAGFFPGPVDGVLMRMVDVGLAVPRIFMVLVATALWTHLDIGPLIVLLGLTGWFATSRLVRAEVMVLRGSPYVDAARGMGAGSWRILTRHVLPNALSPLIVSAALGIGAVMLLEAALSFLGVGVQPPVASWGNMIADGRDQLASAPWTTLFPGLTLALALVALNAVGDALHYAFDRRQ